jgi:hypothetical protein
MSVYSKRELKERMGRFIADPNRGISLTLFCELCGFSEQSLRNIFVKGTADLSEVFQIRVSRVLKSWEDGEIAVMQGRYNTRFAEYRKQPRLRLARSWGLKMTSEGLKVDARVRNKADYGEPTLLEQMEGNKCR